MPPTPSVAGLAIGVDPHGWIDSDTLHTRLGPFEFNGGFPTATTVVTLADLHVFMRAVDVYLAHIPAISQFHIRKGLSDFGVRAPNEMVLWESLMDPQTLFLTGAPEIVCGLTFLDLKRDGPMVIETPPMLSGSISDMWQREIMAIGPSGDDDGHGGSFLVLPFEYEGATPPGFLVGRSLCSGVSVDVRTLVADGKSDKGVALLKRTRVYPLSWKASPPPMSFVDGSGQAIETVFTDTHMFFFDLARLIDEEPTHVVSPHERFLLTAVGIEKGRPFKPDAARKSLLEEAALLGSAIARINVFASSDPERLVYPDRQWEWGFVGGSARWDSQGYVNVDRRAAFAYAAVGMSPAQAKKAVGLGSQSFWTARDAAGAMLDGSRAYRLRMPANVPAAKFWSVVAYDAQTRSMLRTATQRCPTVNQQTAGDPVADGPIDIHFGPSRPKGRERNWIQTIENKGWFALIRFYGPLQPLFDKTWKPGDLEEV